MPNLRRIGQAAEDRAADYLYEKGYTLVTRRFTAHGGEIDLIALDGEILVFVEVKARSAPGFRPEEAVDDVKVRRFTVAADEYVAATGQQERTIRFDLIAIDRDGLRHYEDAFRP